MNLLFAIQASPVYLHGDGHISFLAGMMIDGDGSGGNAAGDPDFQADTSLHRNGAALNAEVDQFIVVPPAIIEAVPQTVLGCNVRVLNRENGRIAWAVVGDIGPREKLGEASIALANALGIPPSPLNGGTGRRDQLLYELWPGVPAQVNGVQYQLQKS